MRGTYDEDGKITGSGDRNSAHMSITYNSLGQRAEVKDVHGHLALRYTYNSAGLLESVEDRTGRKVNYTYTGDRLTKVTDVLGNDWTYTYDSQGQIQTRTDPEGNQIQLFYVDNNPAGTPDGTGFKAAAPQPPNTTGVVSTGKTLRDVKTAKVGTYTDAEGNVTTYQYQYNRTSRQYTTTKISPEGVKQTTVYDKDGRALSSQTGNLKTRQVTRESDTIELVQDARGNTTKYYYDGSRHIVKAIYPDGSSISNTWNSYGQLLTHTDELGTITQYDYDAKGNLIRKTEAKGLPEERITETTYDSLGLQKTFTIKGDTSDQDVISKADYDDYGNIKEYINAEGHKNEYTHNIMGNVLITKDARGYTTEYQYDAAGNQIQTIKAKGQPEEGITSIAYNKVGWATKFTDARGGVVRTTYNKNGQKLEITDALGHISKAEYDKDGKVTKIIDRDNVTKTYAYDTDGRAISFKDGAGNETQTIYGSESDGLNGLVVATQYPTYREEYKYNPRNWQVQTIRILDAQTKEIYQTEFNAAGRAIKKTDPLSRSTQNSYTALGQIGSTTDSLGGVTRYQYDKQGRIIRITDAKGSITQYEYDKLGRKIKETLPLGGTSTYVYDANGNLTEHKSASGRKRVYTYDAINQKIKEEHYLPGQSVASRVIAYTYDRNGNLDSYNDQQNGQKVTSASYVYDAGNRKISQTIDYGTFSKTHTFAYTADGKPQNRTDPDNVQTQYLWSEAAGQLQEIALNGEAHKIGINDYRWNAPQSIAWPNGIRQTVVYDPLMRFKAIHAKKEEETQFDRAYQYNAGSEITQIAKEGKSTMYGYDSLGRLTAVTVPEGSQLPNENYTYDAVHNRLTNATSQQYTYNAGHQLLKVEEKQGEQTAPVKTFDYNEDGHLSKETTQKPTQTERHYTYDAGERLSEVKDNNTTIAKYQYDPFGRRIRKEANGQVIWYGYAEEGLIAEYTSTGTQITAYGYWPSGNWQTNPLYKREGTSYHYYHNDHLGTPQRLTNAQGQISWAADYEAFGNLKEAVNLTENPIRFPGQYHDTETNLYQNYYRDYQPTLGRYVEKDPIGFGGGVNMYAYALSNPVMRIDALGLASKDCCDRQKGKDAPWFGVSGSAGGMALLAGASISGGVLVNTSTGEVCGYAMGCLRLGVGFGASAGFALSLNFVGPYCGKDLSGMTCAVSFVDIAGVGGKGSISVACGGDFSIGGGPGVGAELSVSFDICYVQVLGCFNTPCECL